MLLKVGGDLLIERLCDDGREVEVLRELLDDRVLCVLALKPLNTVVVLLSSLLTP
ncbi:MAG: hypothetical protein ACXADF_18645 [Candidatus Thorarchaeota archaeon]|jgi:hypothetical protein